MPGTWLGAKDECNKMLEFLPHGALRLVGNINKEQWWCLWGNAMTVTGNYWFRWDVAVFSVEVTVTMGT